MDHGLASTTLVYDLKAADFADDLLGLFGLERRLLPRLAPSEAVAGRLTAAGAALTGFPSACRSRSAPATISRRRSGAAWREPGIVANRRWAPPRWWAPSMRGR